MTAYVIRHAGYPRNRVMEELNRLEGRQGKPASRSVPKAKPAKMRAAPKKKASRK